MTKWYWIGRAQTIYLHVTWIARTKIISIWWLMSSIDMWWLNGNGPTHITMWFAPHRASQVLIGQIKMCIRWIALGRHCSKCNLLLVSVMLHRHFQHEHHRVSPNIWSKSASSHRSQQPPKMHRKKCSSQADSSAIYSNFTNTMNSKWFHGELFLTYKCTFKSTSLESQRQLSIREKQSNCLLKNIYYAKKEEKI